MYHGQTLFAVVADTRAQARDAVEQVKTKITPLAPILSIDAAIEQESFLEKPLTLSSGQVENAYGAAPYQLAGELYAGGQEHFYLEGQAAIAQADENGGIQLFVSTQHPSEIQHKVAGMLGLTYGCLLYTSPSPRDYAASRMPSSA